jgi:eukaryotic-like serine/threonine-protein kinase
LGQDTEQDSRLRDAVRDTPLPGDDASMRPTMFQTATEQVPLEPGDEDKAPTIPGYEIYGELGHGAMGVVYRARDVKLNRVVALKILRGADRAGAAEIRRFLAEAEAVARLRHPGIVQVYERGSHRGQPYLALEWCNGGSLAARLNGRPVPPEEAARLAEEVAHAAHAAHAAGIVHRDLKPGNILLVSGESSSETLHYSPLTTHHSPLTTHQPKISDFGLAKWLHGDSNLTQTVAVIGTPSYMAPEQAGGQSKRAGPAADVYALGAILYEMLTGRPPFRGESPLETLRLVEGTEAAAPRSIIPNLPRDLATICQKCLQKEPGRRYGSAAELAEDLRRFRAGEPILARPVRAGERLLKWCRRHPAAAALVLVLTLTTTIVPPVLVWYQSRLSRSQADAAQAEQLKQAAREVAATQEYFARMSQVRRRAAQQQPGWTWKNLDDLRLAAQARPKAFDPVAVRGELAASLGSIDLREYPAIGEGIDASCLAFSPGGGLLAAGQSKAQAHLLCLIRLYELPSNKIVRELGFLGARIWNKDGVLVQDGPRHLAFSPDGRWLFAGTRSGWLYRWDLAEAKNEPDAAWKAHDDEINGVQLSADAQWLYTAARDRTVKRWSAGGKGEPSGRFESPEPIWALTITADTPPRLLVAGGGRSFILDPDTLREEPGRPAQRWDCQGLQAIAAPALVLGGWGSDMLLWPADLRSPPRTLRDPALDGSFAGSVKGVALHPRGRLAAAISEDGKLKVWDVPGGRLRTMASLSEPHALAFSTGGSWLAVAADHHVYPYEVNRPQLQTLIAHRFGPIQDFAVAEGHRVACLSRRALLEPAGHIRAGLTVCDLRDGSARFEEPATFSTAHYSSTLAWRGGPFGFSLGSDALSVWDPDAKRTWSLTSFNPTDFALNYRGNRLWTARGTILTGWTFPEGKQVARWNNEIWTMLTGLGAIESLAAGDRWLAAGGQDGSVRLFAQEPFKLTATWPGQSGLVSAVAFDAGEGRLAAGSQMGRLRVFRVPDGAVLGDVEAHSGMITSLAFSADGAYLVSGGGDRAVRVWRCAGESLELLLTLDQPGPVRRVAFADGDRKLLVLVRDESAVRVWDLPGLRKQFAELGIDW